MKNLSVLINAYDPYEAVWENFFTLYTKYWNVNCPTVFATINKTLNIDRIQCIPTQTSTWSDRAIKALEYIDTEYVFFILDDYFLTEPLSEDEISLHLNFLEQYSANKIMLEYKCRHLTLVDPIEYNGRIVYRLSENSNYLTSMQPSIWKTSYLKSCLKSGWNAWQFEVNGTAQLHGNEFNTYLMLRDDKPYWNAIVKGKKVLDGWDKVQNSEKLNDFII